MVEMSVKEFSAKIRDKKDMYDACVRNGYYLPAIKSNMVTEAYMLQVIEGVYYCPRIEEIRHKACPKPPQKDVLISKFIGIMKARDIKSYGLINTEKQKLLPDKRWLIDIISTLNPGDEIFIKDYLPPARKKNTEEQKSIKMPRDFLMGIPDSRSKAKSRRLKVIGEGQIKQKVIYMRQTVKHLSDQILIQEMKADRLRHKQRAHGTEPDPPIVINIPQSQMSPPKPKSKAKAQGQSGKDSLNSSQIQPQNVHNSSQDTTMTQQ